MKLYLAGPMTGIEDFNFRLFNSTAAALRDRGHEVINPAETDNGDTSNTWDYYIRKDIEHILTVDAVVVLPDWENSFGATFECLLAYLLRLPVYTASEFTLFDEQYMGKIPKDEIKLAFIASLAKKWRR